MLALLIAAQIIAAPTVPNDQLSPDIVHILAQQFIVEGTGMTDWDTPQRVQIWNASADWLRRYGLTVAALPGIRAAYAADGKRLSDLMMREGYLNVDLYVALADNNQKKAAELQPQIDRVKADEADVLRHIRIDTYLREAARAAKKK